MNNILDLTKPIRDLNDELFYLDEEDENYESHKAMLDMRMRQEQWGIERTCHYYADLYLEQKTFAESRKEIANKTAKKAKSAQNKAEWTKRYLKDLMEAGGIKKVTTDYTSTSISAGRETPFFPDDFDSTTLPDEFRKDIPASSAPIKAAITKALKAGADICGLKLLRGESIITFR